MRQGEVWARADTPAYALIVSAGMYNNAGTGRVIVCPVIPGDPLPHDDYAADAGITDPLPGTVLPALVAWVPTQSPVPPDIAVTGFLFFRGG
ncbi:hypothetical protein [Frankia sp. Cr1]|uniref:hypothetical protein n=1 Tax=Frankia sp. Cr1 TaxID=3073931 RepID=UPI002AD28365|nr:hypothetical protein [Frankia sp. Cr1]